MPGRRSRSDDLARIERKLDRLTRLVVALLVLQPVLLLGALLPDATAQPFLLALLVVLAVLAAFPNLERWLPRSARRLGRAWGRIGRRVRFAKPQSRDGQEAAKHESARTAP
jgi:ABC-type transport system involved in cytochrome bd biosynthesis fused ATPase/permease subunit